MYNVKIYRRIVWLNSEWTYLANFMMRKTIIYLLFSLSFASCKSLKSSSSNTSNAGNSNRQKNVRFLDDIALTPGADKNSRQYNNTSQKKIITKDKSILINPSPAFNIESANWLQIKYAILMNVDVESLANSTLLQQIDNWWGTKYCLGGTTGRCIDCSGFTQLIMQSVYNISLPRIARDQYDFTERINREDLKEGDLVFFHTVTRGVSHVGIYLVDNKFVHASTSNGVMISDLNDSYWSTRYIGAGRASGIIKN